MPGMRQMADDSDNFRRRAAQARAAAFQKGDCDSVEVAGHLALAYAALARRKRLGASVDVPGAVDPVTASVADAEPLMLRD